MAARGTRAAAGAAGDWVSQQRNAERSSFAFGRLPSIEALASELDRLRERRGRLFLIGVGGSAGNCSHAVNDFRKLAASKLIARSTTSVIRPCSAGRRKGTRSRSLTNGTMSVHTRLGLFSGAREWFGVPPPRTEDATASAADWLAPRPLLITEHSKTVLSADRAAYSLIANARRLRQPIGVCPKMPRAGSRSSVSTGDVRRLTDAVRKAGLCVFRIDFDVKNGKFSFVTRAKTEDTATGEQTANEWDEALKSS
jgi:hypothetical protein